MSGIAAKSTEQDAPRPQADAAAAPSAAAYATSGPAAVLALQRAAGNAAVGRALAAGSPLIPPTGRRVLARDPPTKVKGKPRRPGRKKGTKAKDAPAPDLGAKWVRPPKTSEPDRLSQAMVDSYNKWEPAEDIFHSDVWALLVMTRGRIHVFDGNQNFFMSVRLKGGSLLPADGFFLFSLDDDGEWQTRRLAELGRAGVAWVPWVRADPDAKGTLNVDELIHQDDRADFAATLGDVTNVALVVSDAWGEQYARRARAQVRRLQEALGLARGKGKGVTAAKGKGTGAGAKEPGPPAADPKTPKDPNAPKGAPGGVKGGTGSKDGKGPVGAQGPKDAPGPRAPDGSQTPGGTGDKPGAGPPAADAPQDVPDAVDVVEGKDGPKIRVSADGAHTDIPYRDGESDAKLRERVGAATRTLRAEVDPAQSVRVQGSGEKAQIDQRPGLGGVPVPEGFPVSPEGLAPNELGYPAKLISHGPDGRRGPQATGREDTVLGATINFTMELDYAARSAGWQDETWNRMQRIAYKWELINITNLDLAAVREKLKSAGQETDSGIARDLGRNLANTWEDTKADVLDTAAHPGMEGYLAVVAIADLVDIGAALISSYFALVSQPLNDRSIGFNEEGVFLLRCFAQPLVDRDKVDEMIAEGRRPVIRAPSVASYPVRVTKINARAKEANDADLAKIAELEKQVDAPPFPQTGDDVREQLAEARAALEDDNIQALDRQEKFLDRELGRIKQWRELDDNGVALDERDAKLRIWRAQLDLSGVAVGEYEKQLNDTKKQLPALRERYRGFGMKEMKKGRRVVRPRMTLVSEVNGQVYPLVANLGEAERSRPEARVWRLIDVTSAETQDSYEGSGTTHTEAIQAAFDRFRDNSEYGRGSLAVRLPVEQLRAITDGETVVLRREIERVRPGSEARVLKRLQSLATAAEIAGMVVAGPAGLAIGVIGGVAGGIVAAENLRRRAAAERLRADFQTAMDIIGVVGAVVAVGGLRGLPGADTGRAGKAAAAASEGEAAVARLRTMEKVADRAFSVGGMVHIAGKGLMHGQWIIMPVALYHELAAIEKEEAADLSKDKGKYRARRLEAWARALKSGAVQVRTMQLQANPEAGWDPFRDKARTPQGGAPPPVPGDTPPAPKPGGDVPAPPTLPPGPPPGPRGKPPRRTGSGGKPTVWAPERPVDASTPRKLRAVTTEALGHEHAPLPDRIRLVDAATVQVLWDTASRKGMARGGQSGEAPIAIYDPDTGHVYVVKDAFLRSADLQQAAFEGVMGHMTKRGREALGEPVARAVGELVMQAAIAGAPELSAATPEARTLQQRLTRLVGQETIERLLYRGEVGAFSSKLSELLGSARGNALEVALRKGDLRMANRLAGEPNPAMSNVFGELLTVATADLLTEGMGGRPRAERWPGQPREVTRSALAREVARMVGQDVLEGALFRGRTEELRLELQRRLGPDGYKAFVDAVRAGDLPGSLKALREPPPLWAQAPRPEKVPLPDDSPPRRTDERRPPTAEPGGPAVPPAPKELGPKAAALRDAVARGESPKALHELALDVIAETGSFKALREQAAGSGKLVEALQAARERLLKEVQAEIARALEQKYPGVEVEFVNLGTPGFNSDMDYTINVKPGKASVNDAIAASVEGVRAAYDVFGGERGLTVGDGFDGARKKVGERRLSPDRVLDSNFYTELHEHAIRPRTAEERLAISGDQSVVSLAEARMNMDPAEWPAYRERMLKSFEDTGADHTGTEADINALARQRLRGQLDAAERLVAELHPPGRTREQVLAGVQQQLLDAIGSGASAREVRALQAKIKLLEPDAYGTRAAKVGVVDQYQGAARAKSRREAWDRLGQGGDEAVTPRERAADAAQEGGASAAKLRHAAPDVGATTAQAISAAKYLARVFEAFRKAGLHIEHPLIRRSGDIIGAKQEAKSADAAMGELRRWAQDTHRLDLQDPQQLRDAFVGEAKRLGDELDLRLRRNEAIMAGMDPTAGELADLAATRKQSGPPPAGPSGGGAAPPTGPPKGPPAGGGKGPPSSTPPAAPTPAAPRRGPGGFDSAAEAGRAVTDAVAKLKHGMDPGETPPNYERALKLLADPKNKSPVNTKLLKLLPIAERGLRTPELYGRVIAEAWERAVLTGTDINGALLQMAKEGGLKVNTVRQAKDAAEFFREDATRSKIIVDKGIGDEHGIHTHLLQDLVVDRALRAAGRSETAAELRALFARVRGQAGGIPLGDLVWRVTYDVEGPGHINDPETLREALRPTGFR